MASLLQKRKSQLLNTHNQENIKASKGSKSFFGCLAKNLFSCNSNRHMKGNNNYSSISYQSNDYSSNPGKYLPQAASTMIQHHENNLKKSTLFPKKAKSSTEKFSFANKSNQSNELSVYVSDEQLNDQFQILKQDLIENVDATIETETTRRCSLGQLISNCPTSNNNFSEYHYEYEQITIVHQQNLSPLGSCNILNLDSSNNSSDYLHSTKIPHNTEPNREFNFSDVHFLHNTDESILSTSKFERMADAPRNSLESRSSYHSSQASSAINSPTNSSSHIQVNNQANDYLQMIDSIISNLSVIEENHLNLTRACVNDYEATFVDDVSVQFADTVRILRDDNDEWLFVQVLNDGRQGFIPKTIAIDLNQFLGKLKEHKDIINKSKNFFCKN
jgi:hypothetical protein